MATGSVIFTGNVSGNYTIGTATIGLAASGSFPSESYTISSASMSISRWRQYANDLSLVVSGNGSQLGTFNESKNETTHSVSFSLTTQSVYSGLSSVTFSSSGSYNVGALRDGAQIVITVNWQTGSTPPVQQYLFGPDIVTINKTATAPGGSATLSWQNTVDVSSQMYIAGYTIERSLSNVAQYFSVIERVTAPMTLSGSRAVTASSTNGQLYYFRVGILSNNSSYLTGISYAAPVTLLATQASAPTAITVSTTTPSPGATFTLSWSGAQGSTNNTITGYDIYRSSTATGTYSKVSTINATSGSGSTTFTAPSVNGASYYYKIVTRGSAGTDCASPLSTIYAGVTATKKLVFAPSVVGTSSQQAYPNAIICLYWSGAAAGDSAIAGYAIYRDTSATGSFSTLLAEIDSTATSGQTFVTAPITTGTTYYYKIQTLSADVGYESDLSTATASIQAQASTPIAGTIGKTNASGWY